MNNTDIKAFVDKINEAGLEPDFNRFVLNERAYNQKYWAEKINQAIEMSGTKYNKTTKEIVHIITKQMLDEANRYLV